MPELSDFLQINPHSDVIHPPEPIELSNRITNIAESYSIKGLIIIVDVFLYDSVHFSRRHKSATIQDNPEDKYVPRFTTYYRRTVLLLEVRVFQADNRYL